jgi:hypothetical protein
MQKADFELISFSYDLQGLGVVAGRFGGGCDPEPPPLLPPPPVLQLYSLFIFKTSTCPIQKKPLERNNSATVYFVKIRVFFIFIRSKSLFAGLFCDLDF